MMAENKAEPNRAFDTISQEEDNDTECEAPEEAD